MRHHGGNPDRSIRLARTLNYVKSAGPIGCTTAELQAYSGSMAPSTDIGDLRKAGHLVDCKGEGTNRNGRKVFRYRYRGRK